MGKNLVVLHQGEPRVSTWELKDGFGFNNDHRYVVRMVEKYKPQFESFGVIASQRQQPTKKKGGRPIEAFLLNEDQAMFLGTLFRNTERVVEFKQRLVTEFSRKKRILAHIAAQKQNAEYLEIRAAGKETRSIAMDTVKTFVGYAKHQGSNNAERYYANISKMENKALFLLEQKYKNLREVLNIHQLSTIKSADAIVMKALGDGMERGLHYKEVYKLAKLRVESFAEMIGKSVVPYEERKDNLIKCYQRGLIE